MRKPEIELNVHGDLNVLIHKLIDEIQSDNIFQSTCKRGCKSVILQHWEVGFFKVYYAGKYDLLTPTKIVPSNHQL